MSEQHQEVQPERALSLWQRGQQLVDAGQLASGLPLLRQAAALAPGRVQWRFRLGQLLIGAGALDEAVRLLEGVVAALPGAPAARLELAAALSRQGDDRGAEAALRAALVLKPDMVQAWHNLGNLLHARGDAASAEAAWRQALEVQPLPVTLHNLASCLAEQNRTEEAAALANRALLADPRGAASRWQALRVLPIIYPDLPSQARWRSHYRSGLTALERRLELDGLIAARSAEAAIQDAFHLHYQGGDLRELQAIHGRLIARIMAASRPGLRAQAPPRLAPGERVRVGFVSSFLCTHTVAKLFYGWITGLDPARFEVRCYHLGERCDELSQRLAAASDCFTHAPRDPIALARRIRDDRPHALIYPELGMDAACLKLAGLRLAPLQCVGWGHPVTTGLPTIDAFLSSAAMEPPGAQAHYTEELVALPGLGIRPSPTPAVQPGRARFGLQEGDRVFLIAQTLYKLLPQHDWILPAIAARVPGARFVFIARGTDGVKRAFRERLEAAFVAAGQDPAGLVWLSKLAWSDYLALNASSDVFLDGLSWSGGMTTLEALSLGLVPVTCPGPVMRARHTAAILGELGIAETVAESPERYVEIAARLALEPGWRRGLQARIAQALPGLYGDRRGVEALERFLLERLGRA